jgi:hypothetical protein
VRPQRLTTVAVYGLAVLSLGLAGTCAAHLAGFRIEPAAAGADGSPREDMPRVRLANSGGSWPFSFLESLFGVGPQSAPRRVRPQEYRRMPQSAPPRQDPAPPAAGAATYRTMCVRLCDGYYWPVSFATVKDQFRRDAETCAKSCGMPVALYHYPNPGGEPEEMVNLEGEPYKTLRTAFLYRATYDPSCKCRAHPWEEAAIERHKGYAKAAEQRTAVHRTRRNR